MNKYEKPEISVIQFKIENTILNASGGITLPDDVVGFETLHS